MAFRHGKTYYSGIRTELAIAHAPLQIGVDFLSYKNAIMKPASSRTHSITSSWFRHSRYFRTQRRGFSDVNNDTT